ncbi:MAG: protein translocase subunit SecF [Bacteroidetes bacterium]|jgi:preprotein translocase subunit SecF|nr:protein translocase subunit SecF [Bacteroidota bacterium]
MRLFKTTNIPFLDSRGLWYIVSSIVIAAGLVAILVRGVSLGIDFLGGTEIVVGFKQAPEIGKIRAALSASGLEGAEIKTFGEPTDIIIRTTEQAEGTVVGDRIREALAGTYGAGSFDILRQYKISPKIGKELREDALYAIAWGLVAIMLYVAVRFKFSYGVGAVLSLFHDVLVTLGVIVIINGVIPGLNLEITLEVIAAFLTLVGVSVNDTVVVFDRIRENQRLYRSMDLKSVMNKSLNEMLGRTIITNGTILAVLFVLLFFGGEVTRAFAFTLVIGQLTGTYSSIYVASAIVLDWPRRLPARQAGRATA